MRAGFCDVEIPDWATHVAYWMPPQVSRHDGWWELATAEGWDTDADPWDVEWLPEGTGANTIGTWAVASLGIPVSVTFLGVGRIRRHRWGGRSYDCPVYAIAPARIGEV